MFLYRRITEDIRNSIFSGELAPTAALPTERELAKQYRASGTSVRKAMAILEEEGLIVKRHGSGNYVNQNRDGLPDLLLVLCGNLARYRPGIGKAFEELCSSLPFTVEARLEKSDITLAELGAIEAKYPDTPLLIVNTRNGTAELAAAGKLDPLDHLTAFSERLERMPDNLKWAFPDRTGAEAFYGSPFTYLFNCLAVNEDLAKSAGLDPAHPPRTWGELAEWCATFTDWKKKAGRNDLYASYLCGDRYLMGSLSSYFRMAGGGDAFSNSPELGEGLRALYELLSGLFHHGDLHVTVTQSPAPFVGGKYLLGFQAGTWLPRDAGNFNPALNYRLCPIPQPDLSSASCYSGGCELMEFALNGSGEEGLARLKACSDLLCDLDRMEPILLRLGVLPADSLSLQAFVTRHPEFTPFRDAMFHTLEPHHLEENELEEKLCGQVRQLLRSGDADIPRLVREYRSLLKR